MSNATATKNATRVLTPVAILSYPWVSEPQPPMEGSTNAKMMYSAVLVFAPAIMARFPQFGTNLDALRAAAKVAGEDKFANQYAAMLANPNFKSGFRSDIAGKGYPEGSIFVNSRNERRPGLVYLYPAADGKPAIVPDDEIEDAFYPGALVRADLRAFGYNKAGNRGVSFALNNLQLIDGTAPRLDSRVAAQDAFEADASVSPASLDDVGAE